MKKIVVVEDRPWFTMDATVRLQEKGIVFYRMIYYPSALLNSKDQNELMDKYKVKTKVEVIEVQQQRDFLDKIDELYREQDIVFLMDYDLKGDMSVDNFYSRINIKYAMEKRKENGEDRIWFYTTGGADVKRVLCENFENRVISTPKFINSQLQWDEDQILKMVSD
jgi:hypothetical protein